MLNRKKLFLLDIDGTVCKGKQLLPGAKEFLEDIKRDGRQFVFITNNATKGIDDYIKFFLELGIVTDYMNYVTSSYVTVQYLKMHYLNKLIYVMGTESFIQELEKNHIRVTTDSMNENIDCVLISYDSQLTYKKIQECCELLSTRKVDYVATNPDLVCPVEFGYVPDCGAICELLAHAVKRMPYFIGKPEPYMVESAIKINHSTKEETLIVGDRLYTDILCGNKAGVETALVLTGEASMEDADQCEYKPDYIFSSIENIHKICIPEKNPIK